MSIADVLGDPIPTVEDLPVPPPSKCARTVQTPDPPQPTRKAAGHRWWPGLMLALLTVGIVVWITMLQRGTPGPTQSDLAAPAAAGHFAEFLVSVHLSGTAPPTDSRILYPGGRVSAASTGYWVGQAGTISLKPLGAGVWLATVAADVLEAVDDTYEPAGLHYYEVAVDTTGPTPQALAAPARIPAPDPVATDSRFNTPLPPEKQAAVDAFVQDWLTETEGRHGLPIGSGVWRGFADPPYESARVLAVAADQADRIWARVEATSASGATTHLDYLLDLMFRQGMWEVSTVGLGEAPGE